MLLICSLTDGYPSWLECDILIEKEIKSISTITENHCKIKMISFV